MALMTKIKQALGIGGVKVRLTASPEASTSVRQIDGSVDLQSKSDQLVTRLIVTLVEHRSTGKGAEAKHDKYELGETLVAQDVQVGPGKPAHFDFNLPFLLRQSMTEKMQRKGGVVGVMGKLGSLAESERIQYKLSAQASVKGRMLAASHSIDIKMT